MLLFLVLFLVFSLFQFSHRHGMSVHLRSTVSDCRDVGCARLTSPERATFSTGIVPFTRGAAMAVDSLGRLLRSTLLDEVVSMVFSIIRFLLNLESTRSYINSTSKST